MARPLRIEFEDALYHVTSRGNRRQPIFVDDADRRRLLDVIGEGMERFDATAFAYCLMNNHYHIVLRTRRSNLSRLMRHVNGTFAQAYNRRHGCTGHLFQGRFHAVVVQHEAYFLQVCRYVDLNPVRAGVVGEPRRWRWSSYRAHAGLASPPPWLDSETLHGMLVPAPERALRTAAYVRFVAEGRDERLWEKLRHQIFLGDETFVQQMQAKVPKRRISREIPRQQREAPRRSLQDYLDEADRDTAIARACIEGGHRQSAVARVMHASRSHVSRLVARYRATNKT